MAKKVKSRIRLHFFENKMAFPFISQPKLSKYFFPKVGDILFIALLFGCNQLGARMLSIDSDLGRHLTLGNIILDTGTIPIIDILSHTKEGQSRPPYEWGAQVLFATANRIAGLDGVVLLTSLVVASTFLLAYVESVKLSKAPIASVFATILCAGASSIHWLPRPHIFTFLLLLLWVVQLEKLRKEEHAPIWVFPIIMLFWANLHGGFIFGFLAWFASLAGEIWQSIINKDKSRLSKLLQVGLLAGAASIITPDGWRNWQAVLGNNSRYILQNTVETMPPSLRDPGMFPFWILFALVIILPVLTRTRLHPGAFFLTAGMGLMALIMARNIPLFALVALLVLSQSLPGRFKTWNTIEENILHMQNQVKSGVWIVLFGCGLSAFIIIRFLSNDGAVLRFNPAVFPVQAADWLEENPQAGNMFNEFNWGGYLEYRLHPRLKVFLDSQTDFYGEPLMLEYEQVISVEGDWKTILETYNIEWTIVPADSALADTLADKYDWQILYKDETAIILEK